MDKTNIKIDNAVLEKTTSCEHNFNCLTGDKAYICEVKSSMGYEMLDIKPNFAIDCKSGFSFVAHFYGPVLPGIESLNSCNDPHC